MIGFLPRRAISQPTQAPQIDRANPLTKGLDSYMPLAGVAASDAADNRAWSVVIGATPIAFDTAPRGRALRIKGATPTYTSRLIPATISTSTTQPLTIRFRLYLLSSAAAAGIVSWGSTAADGSPRFYARINAASQLNFYFGGAYSYAKTVAVDTEYIVTHSFDGTAHSTYLNGELLGATSRAWAGNAGSFFLGSGFDAAKTSTDFLVSDFVVWTRGLSAQEVASDAANPWQITRSLPVMYAPNVVAGGRNAALGIALGGLSASGASTVRASAASATSFGALAATGAITHPVAANSATTLSGLSVLAAGSTARTAASSTTMGALQLAATAAVSVAPAASITLGSVQAASSATATVAGTSSATLGALTLSSAVSSEASPARVASLLITLGTLTLASAATSPAPRSAALSMDLGALGVAATGTATLTAAVAGQLQALGVSSAANTPNTGRATILLDGMIVSASGYQGDNEPIVFVRAPSGNGYAPQRAASVSRPSSASTWRPAAIQRNNR